MPENQTKTPLLKEGEVAERLAIEVSTLRRWRWAGTGPRFVKIGEAVRYEPSVIEQFIVSGRRKSTSSGISDIAQHRSELSSMAE